MPVKPADNGGDHLVVPGMNARRPIVFLGGDAHASCNAMVLRHLQTLDTQMADRERRARSPWFVLGGEREQVAVDCFARAAGTLR